MRQVVDVVGVFDQEEDFMVVSARSFAHDSETADEHVNEAGTLTSPPTPPFLTSSLRSAPAPLSHARRTRHKNRTVSDELPQLGNYALPPKEASGYMTVVPNRPPDGQDIHMPKIPKGHHLEPAGSKAVLTVGLGDGGRSRPADE
jgi:hypothetical protein